MAKRRIIPKNTDDTLIDLEEVTGNAKNFLDRYQNILLIAVTGIAVLVGGFWAYNNLYKTPKEIEAADQMFQAELQFQKDSFQLALENPGGGFDGFLSIIDKYSGTPQANLAKYYAGICYLNMGKFDEAIQYLQDYSPKGEVMTIMTNGAIGDAHAEKDELDKAITFYEKAAKAGSNSAVTPYYYKKLGMLHEKQGNMKAALEAYQKVRDEYPTSSEGQNIEKYIYRAEAAQM
jgi:tetratricopeptide (TPR) repeat protein